MSRELLDVSVIFLSLVDRPANRRPFLVAKRDNGSVNPADVLNESAAEFLAKGFTKAEVEQIAQRMIDNRRKSPCIFKSSDRPFEYVEAVTAANQLKINKRGMFKGIL